MKPAATLSKAKARSVLSSLLLSHPCEMEIADIAWSLGLYVREADLVGCDGRLVRQGRRGVISVKQSIVEPGKKRLTIAHEIGHFVLHQGASQLEVCADPGALAWYLRDRPEEKEANVFAAELLMPEELMVAMCRTLRPNFDSIRKIAEEFQVTFTAAAMRFVDLTPERCALVFSQDSRISWAKPSSAFGYFLASGTLLDHSSHAMDFFEGKTPPKEMTKVFAQAWLTDRKVNGEAQLSEQSFAMDRYKSVLTLLWLDQDVEHEDPPERPHRRDDEYQDEERRDDY